MRGQVAQDKDNGRQSMQCGGRYIGEQLVAWEGSFCPESRFLLYFRSISNLSDFKAWDYTRTNFTCIVKRLLKVKRLTSLDLASALEQSVQ